MSTKFCLFVYAGACCAVSSSCDKLVPTPTAKMSRAGSDMPSEKLIPVVKLPSFSEGLITVKYLLTGNASRTWVLDNSVAGTITVGTNASPATYYAGGAVGSLPTCQADDEYTFTNGQDLVYDAKFQTFTSSPAYACQAPRSATVPFTLGPAVGAGLAQLVLTASVTNPLPFIGTTDAAPDRIYRIISINDREMVLRGGGANADPVFTFKMRVR